MRANGIISTVALASAEYDCCHYKHPPAPGNNQHRMTPRTPAYLRGCYGLTRIRGPECSSKVVPAVEHGAAAPVYVGEAVSVLLHTVLVVHLFAHGAH